jgi:hypothetical protein
MMAGSTDITVSVNSLIFSANMNPNPAGDITNISIGDIGIVGSSLFFVFGDCVLMGM